MDDKYIRYALQIANKGSGFTNPNPLVGAVIVKDDEIIGEGYHEYYGGPHAEVNAFSNAKEDVEGATLYVTLEPCSHYGKTPPCVEKIIEKKIKKVVVGMKDPNPLVSGKGIKILRSSGIEVITNILEDECKKQNEIFIKYITTNQPFCIYKSAMTLDGKIATSIGDSKWVSGEKSRGSVHILRQKVSAIMIGVGTAIADNPMLTARLKDVKTMNPVRVIIDTKARLSMGSNLVKTAKKIKTIIATTQKASEETINKLVSEGVEILMAPLKEGKVDISYVVSKLGEMGIDSILIEGGSTLGYSFLEENLIDKVMFFIAPKLVGGKDAITPMGGKGISLMRNAVNLDKLEVEKLGKDILISGYPNRRRKMCLQG